VHVVTFAIYRRAECSRGVGIDLYTDYLLSETADRCYIRNPWWSSRLLEKFGVVQWIRIAIDLFLNFGYVTVTVVLALETGRCDLRICIYLLKFALMINV